MHPHFDYLSTPFGKNKVSRDVCKKLHFKINFRSILGPPNVPRIYKKSVLEVILGQEGSREISSSANMAPRTDFDRFSIDVSLIWGWIVQALATKLRIPDRRHRPQGLYNPPRCEGFTAAGRVGTLCLQSHPPAHPLYNFLHTSCEAVAKATS